MNATGFFESLRLPQNDFAFEMEPLPTGCLTCFVFAILISVLFR